MGLENGHDNRWNREHEREGRRLGFGKWCGQKMAVIIDGTVNMNVKDADLVLVSGGQKMAVMIDGTVNMNMKDADLVLVSGGQKMAVIIDGTVNMNVKDSGLVPVSGG